MAIIAAMALRIIPVNTSVLFEANLVTCHLNAPDVPLKACADRKRVNEFRLQTWETGRDNS